MRFIWDAKGVIVTSLWWDMMTNFHERHPIARSSGRGMGCFLWVQLLIDILPQFLQWCVHFDVILDRVKTALQCNIIFCCQMQEIMMTSSNGNIFRVTGHLCGEFIGEFIDPRWIPHKGQWRGTLMFSLICVWINGWVNNGEAGDLRRYRAHYEAPVMF